MKKVYLIKKIQKKTVLFAAAAAFFAGAFGTQPAYAASYVNSVRIQLDIDLEDGDSLPHLDIGYTGDSSAEVAVPSSNRYDIHSARWTDDVDEVRIGRS